MNKKKTISTLKYAFLVQIIMMIGFFLPLSSWFHIEVFEAVQQILTSRTRWKIPRHADVLNTVIEFSRKQEY